jgi:hypothetical protein
VTLGLALSMLERDAPAAAGLMRLLAFLAPEPVTLGPLLAGQDAAEQLGTETAEALGPLLGDPLAVGDAVAALRRYSLAVPAGDGLVQVHRLVQAVTRIQLDAEQAGEWKEAAAALVEAAIPGRWAALERLAGSRAAAAAARPGCSSPNQHRHLAGRAGPREQRQLRGRPGPVRADRRRAPRRRGLRP